MTTRDVAELVIEPMRALWRAPGKEVDGSDATVSLYCAELANFRREALISGMKNLVGTWKKAYWPTIAELIAVFREAQSFTGAGKEGGVNWKATFEKQTAAELRLDAWWHELHSAEYAQATEEGWAMDLRGAIRERANMVAQHMHPPTGQGLTWEAGEQEMEGFDVPAFRKIGLGRAASRQRVKGGAGALRKLDAVLQNPRKAPRQPVEGGSVREG